MGWLDKLLNKKNAGSVDKKYLKSHPYQYPVIKQIKIDPKLDKKKKKQGYKDREDESLGMRTGKESTKKQSMKARRDESYG